MTSPSVESSGTTNISSPLREREFASADALKEMSIDELKELEREDEMMGESGVCDSEGGCWSDDGEENRMGCTAEGDVSAESDVLFTGGEASELFSDASDVSTGRGGDGGDVDGTRDVSCGGRMEFSCSVLVSVSIV